MPASCSAHFVYLFLVSFYIIPYIFRGYGKKRNYLNFVILDLSDQRDRYSGRISVPDGTLTFLIALPPFQGHKINQYIFLQLYYSLFLLSHNHRNFALVPLNTNESVRFRFLASANASNDLQNDKNLL